jgi:hypothetical protein
MGVAIDEARHHHFSGGVDFHSLARFRQILNAACGADLAQDAVADQQCAIGNDANFV